MCSVQVSAASHGSGAMLPKDKRNQEAMRQAQAAAAAAMVARPMGQQVMPAMMRYVSCHN